MRLLVAGGREVDAGKTTFTLGLQERLGGVAVKPRAANSWWYDIDVLEDASLGGSLFGMDARRIAASNPSPWDEPTVLNPLHRVWKPIAPDATGMLGQRGRAFVVDRIGDEFVVNERVEVPAPLRDRLSLDAAPTVNSIETMNQVIADRHFATLSAFTERLQEVDTLIVESYSDIALPLRDLKPRVAVVVTPELLRIYDGKRFADACSVASKSPRSGVMEPVVSDVTDLLEPLERAPLRPLMAEERSTPSAIASAYASAIDVVLTAAEA